MIPGLPNTYYVTPLYKMQIYHAKADPITKKFWTDSSEYFSVLFNPQSYTMSRKSMPDKDEKDAQSAQPFPATGPLETLDVDFFIDTFSASVEVGGLNGVGLLEVGKFTGNAEVPSYTKFLSAMDYANKLYDLCLVDAGAHSPPALILKWKDSLFFPCYMQTCSVEYTKFKETGVPVRAIVHCTFVGIQPTQKVETDKNPLESPDTAKFHQVEQGETLNDLAEIAYQKPSRWREVAVANGIVNPRLLNSGDVLRMPAL